jgi:hypothetical protein
MKPKYYILIVIFAMISIIHTESSIAEWSAQQKTVHFLRPLSFAHRIEVTSEEVPNNQEIPVYKERNGITLVGFIGGPKGSHRFISAVTDLESSIAVGLPRQNMRVNRLTLNDRGEKAGQYEWNVEIVMNAHAMEKFRASGLVDSRGILPAQNVGYIEAKPDGSLIIIDFDERQGTTYKRIITNDGAVDSIPMLNEAKQAMMCLSAAAARGVPGVQIYDYRTLRTVTYMGEVILRGDFVLRTPSRVTVCKGMMDGNKFVFYNSNGKRISIDNTGTFETEVSIEKITSPPVPVSGLGAMIGAARYNTGLFSQI